MQPTSHTWGLVLAAGDGRRLSALTCDAAGTTVPKQYCTLGGGASLLQAAIDRARKFARPENVSVVVAQAHRRWWWPLQGSLPARNLVVQPRNCGTANGILLQLLHIEQADPAAEVVLLPSDHLVTDEETLRSAIERALQRARAEPSQVVLLGMRPAAPDPELGYIVPGPPDQDGTSEVLTFVEKPAASTAALLVRRGALANSFILAARCQTLIGWYAQTQPELLQAMRGAMDVRNDRRAALTALYEQLPVVDFSKHLLESTRGAALRVEPVGECGWSDLGTPERIGRAIPRLGRGARLPARVGLTPECGIDLVARYQQWLADTRVQLPATA